MSYEPRLIAPYSENTGLVERFRPWLIGDAAFSVLEDAYPWRGKIRKREGYEDLAYVPSEATIIAITQASPANVTVVAIGNLQAGDIITIRNVVVGMVEINEQTVVVNNVVGAAFDLLNLDGTNFDSTGFTAYIGGGTVHLPVNGLANFLVLGSEDEQLVAFTRYKASIFNVATGIFNNISFFQTTGAALSWAGTLNGYYWSVNYADSLWVTNNVDPIRFYNGTAAQGWNNQRFTTNAAGHLVTRARLITPYYGRLLILDTTENGVNYHQRARWSQIGTPYVPATGGDPAVVEPGRWVGSATNQAWRDDVAGRGGYIDADTSERIISISVVNDTLIVFFQFSTWRLRYTGNQVLPFVWERINTNYGSEAQFGTINFNDMAFTLSRRGIIGADTNNVKRIDDKIPDRAFEIETGDASESLNIVSATRDYYRDMVYWSVPSADVNAETPNRIIALSLEDGSWSIFNMPFRVFGQYKEFDDRTWAMFNVANRDEWENQTENYWVNPFLQDNAPIVTAGHLNGYVYRAFEDVSDGTDDGTHFNFDIQTKRFNPYISQGRDCRLEYVDLYLTSTTQNIIQINAITQNNPGRITTTANHGLVTGTEILLRNIEGMVELNNRRFVVTVINATNFDINEDTTNYAAYTANGEVVNNAEITFEHYLDDNDTVPIVTRTVTISHPGEEANYYRVFTGNEGRFHQLRLRLSNSQLNDNLKGRAGMEMQGMVIWTRPSSRTKGALL